MVDGIGRVLGDRYRLTALIGTGASASVYLADDRKLGRQVAVKLLHPSLADDAAFLHRFREEARSAAKLNHPGLMAVYDTGEDAGGPYLVLELLGGGSLRALLDSGERLTVSQALAVGIEAAHALERAHAEGIVHRDIKPANLLFGTDGRLRIADFGLARALSESGFTDHGDRLVGTARYAAPEQARGVRVDGKADVYALGLVLSEAITGVVPLVRDGPVETLMARIETPVPVPAAVGPLAGVLERMGRPDPAERPSAAEVAAELLALVPSVPRPVPLPLAGVDLESPTGDDELTMLPDDRTGFLPPVAPDPPKARRVQRRWVLAGLAALVAVTGGGAAVWAMSRPPTFEVPNVAGMPLADAEAALQAAMDDAGDVTWRVGTAETYHRNVAEGAVISQSPAAGTDLRDGARITLTVSQGPPPVLIPDLTGRTPAEAQALLEGVNLRLGDQTLVKDEDAPKGTVRGWQVDGKDVPGPVPEETEVDLIVADGPPLRVIPAVAGQTEAQAKAALEALRLVVDRREAFSTTVEAGKVVAAEPAEGTSVERDSKVTLVVSKGRDLVAVPQLRNLNAEQAKRRLDDVGLVGEVQGILGGKVFATNPAEGTMVARGSKVVVILQ